MNKDDLHKIVSNPKLIPGIHSYCDRWCERCAFTTKCAVSAIEKADKSNTNMDVKNKAFWDSLDEMFSISLEMINETAKELGVDLSAVDHNFEIELKDQETASKTHPLAQEAMDYTIAVDQWFQTATEILQAKENQLNLLSELGFSDAEIRRDGLAIKDSIQVVQYYFRQVYVKLRRALFSAQARPELLAEFPRDSDGSAKVALIGIDRSISAWANLRNHLPEDEDIILDILIKLARLRNNTETAFPAARSFKRPGFDD